MQTPKPACERDSTEIRFEPGEFHYGREHEYPVDYTGRERETTYLPQFTM